MSEARVDQWLWAVRVYKTRSAATDACRGGHVKVNDRTVKASHPVRAGDRVAAKIDNWTRVLEVVQPITRRVSAAAAGECVVDHSPPRPKTDEWGFPIGGRRETGTGRPTKRDRRLTDRIRRRGA